MISSGGGGATAEKSSVHPVSLFIYCVGYDEVEGSSAALSDQPATDSVLSDALQAHAVIHKSCADPSGI